MTTLDMFDDPELSLLSEDDLPEFAKEATVKPIEDYDRFALVYMTKEGEVRKKYPIDDDAMTWCSAQYFEANHDNLTEEAQKVAASNIKEAAERYGIETDGFEALTENYDADKSGQTMMKEADVVQERLPEVEQGTYYLLPEQQQYPADTEKQVKTAEAYFEKHAEGLGLEERRKYARRLVNRARDMDVDLGADTKRYASEQKAEPERVKLAFEARKQHVSEGMENKLDRLYDNRERVPANVMAEALRDFDKQAEITHLWDRSIPDPDKSVRGAKLEYETKEASTAISYDGYSFTAEDLKNLPSEELERHFDSDQVNEIKDNPKVVFEALPDQHKEIIVGLIRDRQE